MYAAVVTLGPDSERLFPNFPRTKLELLLLAQVPLHSEPGWLAVVLQAIPALRC